MTLTTEQRQAIENGETVPVTVGETECVIVRKDVYDQICAACDQSLPAEVVAGLVEDTMDEYDADDPLLESYQKYRQ